MVNFKEMKRKIVRNALNPHLIVNNVKTAELNVSTKTVIRCLHRTGLKAGCPRKTLILKSKNLKSQ